MLRQLRQDRAGQQTTITSTTRAVWSRGSSRPPHLPTPPPTRQLSTTATTDRQIPRSLLGDSRQHLCSPRPSFRTQVTIRSDAEDPLCHSTTSLIILNGECDPTQFVASHPSTNPQIYEATYRRPGISTRPRSPEHFIIIFGLIVHLCLMIVCVMSNAHYPNLLRSLSKEDFIVWKLVLAAAFL
jgi:hypothetical protein